jgi:hypothetical protein
MGEVTFPDGSVQTLELPNELVGLNAVHTNVVEVNGQVQINLTGSFDAEAGPVREHVALAGLSFGGASGLGFESFRRPGFCAMIAGTLNAVNLGRMFNGGALETESSNDFYGMETDPYDPSVEWKAQIGSIANPAVAILLTEAVRLGLSAVGFRSCRYINPPPGGGSPEPVTIETPDPVDVPVADPHSALEILLLALLAVLIGWVALGLGASGGLQPSPAGIPMQFGAEGVFPNQA